MNTKLHQLQQKVGAISKDATNPFYKSKYFDINGLLKELKPLLNDIGLTIIQPFDVKDGKSILVTIIKDSETGDELGRSNILLPDNIDPQKMGSAITYYRRYSLQSMLLLEAEDDDGNSTATPQVQQKEYSQPTPTAPPIEGAFPCQSCKSTNVKHMIGTSKKTGKPYDFYSCQDCKFTMN